MSELLARLARTLTQHWKRGLAGAVVVGGTLSRDGRPASVDVRYDVEPQDLDKADGEALLAAAIRVA